MKMFTIERYGAGERARIGSCNRFINFVLTFKLAKSVEFATSSMPIKLLHLMKVEITYKLVIYMYTCDGRPFVDGNTVRIK